MAKDNAPVIIKKVVKGHGHGHHGGSWKIAYADFVTAMMAFFMLLWLLSSTTEEQKKGLADYFSPSTPSSQNSGNDGVMGGQSMSDEGARSSGSVMLDATPTMPQQSAAQSQQSAAERMIAAREEDRFRQAQEDLQTELENIPEIGDLAEHLIVDITPEGMRIQIVDNDDRSMFREGTADLFDHARRVLRGVANVVIDLPNRIMVAGHTDSTGFAGAGDYTNWELSADRANAARRVLAGAGIADERFYEVIGKADTEPLFPEDPTRAANRRITIVLMREAPVLPPGYIR